MAKQMTHGEFVKRVKELGNDEYTVLDTYVNTQVKVHLKHNCGYVWEVTPRSFLNNGARCKRCMNKKQHEGTRTTKQEFKDEVYKLCGNEYSVGDDYVAANRKVTFTHNACGYSWKTRGNHFTKDNSRCPKCAGVMPKNTKMFRKLVHELDNDYELIGTYKDANTPIKMLHKSKNHAFYVTPHGFEQGTRCTECSIASQGEEEVRTFLRANNIDFERQKRFAECKDKKTLPFDFYIPSVNTCIEYQGQQHYQIVSSWGGEEEYNYQLKHDKIKADYCKNNGISLITIPYYGNVNSMLAKELLPLIEKKVDNK